MLKSIIDTTNPAETSLKMFLTLNIKIFFSKDSTIQSSGAQATNAGAWNFRFLFKIIGSSLKLVPRGKKHLALTFGKIA
jgi:hypothetical protein